MTRRNAFDSTDGSGRGPVFTFLSRCNLVFLATLLLAGGILRAEMIRFRHLTEQDGLAQKSVNSILQDEFGFMWFATQDGLNRYDGVSIDTFRSEPADPNTMVNSEIRTLHQDDEGVLWIGTSGGMSRWDRRNRTFTNFRHDPSDLRSLSNDQVWTILEDSRRTIWVGTDDGLNRYDPASNDFVRFLHDENDPTSLHSNQIRAVLETRDNAIWMATYGGGLSHYDPETGHFATYRHDPEDSASISDDLVRTAFEDSRGVLWVGTYNGGLNRLDRITGSFERFQHDPEDSRSLSNNRIRALLEDSEGSLWIATDDGLNRFDHTTGSFHHFHNSFDPTSLGDNRILSLFQDRGGVFWVGTRNGLSYWNPVTSSLARYAADPDAPSTLSSNSIQGFAYDRDGALWISTHGGGLNRLDPSRQTYEVFRHDPDNPTTLSNDRTSALLIDSRGTLWIGTYEAGLNRFNRRDRTFTHYTADPDNPGKLASNAVIALLEDRSGAIWVGTYRAGLHRFNRARGSFARYRHDANDPQSLSSDNVTSLYEDKTGNLWIGTDGGGLNRFDPATESFVRFTHDPGSLTSLSSDSIFSIIEDRDGVMWIGTFGDGLNRWSPEDKIAERGSFRRFTEKDGLPNSVVYGILEDDRGHLWMSTNRGIWEYNPTSGESRTYDRSSGLTSDEFNFGANHKAPTGEMFFGSDAGFNAFYPDQVRVNDHVPPVALTAIYQLNKKIELDTPTEEIRHLDVAYEDHHVLSFSFAGLDYTAPEKNLYAYMLEGFDEEWSPAGELRRATYTNLDPGRYVFRVKAANNDGIWNDAGLSLAITVAPPFWRTWWSYLVYALAIVAASVRFMQLRARKWQREAKYRAELEREVGERTGELAEKNRDLELMNRKLEDASITDTLTGLRNRRYLLTSIGRDIGLIERQYSPPPGREPDTGAPRPDLLFLIFDLDGFKAINDTYGHAAGDRVLIDVSRLLEEICRKSDTLIRWGGDEFLVVGRYSDLKSAELLAERVRATIADWEFDLGAGHTGRVTCSIGFASFPFLRGHPARLSWEQVISIADRALYVSKNSRGNGWTGMSSTRFSDPRKFDELALSLSDRFDRFIQEAGIEVRTSSEHEQATRSERNSDSNLPRE